MSCSAAKEQGKSTRYPVTDVYLFGTCLVDLFFPEVGMDAIALLEQLGLTVHYPQAQSCCGQPAHTSGHPHEAREVARAQLRLFPQAWPIVVPSGSCAGMMKHHWPTLFAGDPDEGLACEVGGRVVEVADFLANVLDWQPQDHGAPTRVAVHVSCSARREMQVHPATWAMVDRLANVERVVHDHESECCGFGGTFALRHPEIAGAMVTDKAAALQDSAVDEYVTTDCGCLANINGKLAKDNRTALRGRHLVSFLRARTKVQP